MIGLKTFGDGSLRNQKSEAVRPEVLVFDGKLSISVLVLARKINPARSKLGGEVGNGSVLVNFSPKTIYGAIIKCGDGFLSCQVHAIAASTASQPSPFYHGRDSHV
jgi:hypothetical protein